MHLGIDAREIQNGVYTGIGRPLANFLEYFSGLNNEDACILFSARKVPIDFGPRIKNVVLSEHITFIWDQWQLPQALKQEEVDLFYSPYYKVPLMKPCPMVSSILDLMYLSFEPYYKKMSPLSKAYYAVFGKLYTDIADKILTCSEYSKRDIQCIYGVQEQKIKVIPLSVGNIYRRELGTPPVKGRYVLYVGNFKIHKNVKSIVESFALIANSFPDLNLVLAGPKGHTYKELLGIAQKNGLQERVIFLGKITEADHPQFLYSGAEVFVMPTLYEGFGLPPLEAMACGVPVVASNTTSIPEVVKDAGLLVDPMNPSAIANAIKEVLTNDRLKKEMIAKGLRYSQEYESTKVSAQLYDFLKGMSKK
ncbi:MAG: glycosyltransferase family 4 protein [Candidatus Omnitrophica bacterium]|nr:glycosyltransferase family 4 protein [Candidatus Omnitrophota bacterium]